MPGVCPAWRPGTGHRSGPHPATPRRLGSLHRSRQSPESLSYLPQPQDDGGNAAKARRFACPLATITGGTLRRTGGAGARARHLLAHSPRVKKVWPGAYMTAGRPSRENFSPPGFSGVSGVSDSDTPHRERGSIWFGWNAACEVPASIAPHTQAGAAGSARCGHPATEPAGIPRSLAVTPRPTTLVSITHQPRLC